MNFVVACVGLYVGMQDTGLARWTDRFAQVDAVQVRLECEAAPLGATLPATKAVTALVEETVLIWPDGLRHTSFFPGVQPAAMVPGTFADHRAAGVEIVFGCDRLGSIALRPAAGTFDGRRFETPVEWDIGNALTAYCDRIEWAMARAVVGGKIGELRGPREGAAGGGVFVFENDSSILELRELSGVLCLTRFTRLDAGGQVVAVSEFSEFRDISGLGPTASRVIVSRTALSPVPGETRYTVAGIATVTRSIGECSAIDVGNASRLDRTTGEVVDSKGRVLGVKRSPGTDSDGSRWGVFVLALSLAVFALVGVGVFRRVNRGLA